ncbi:MAG: hypothetical protein AAGB12_08890 [Pseudomonadota bacterium]
MFRPSDIIIAKFTDLLVNEYEFHFGENPQHTLLLKKVSRMTLSQVALSDALYHNLDHAVNVSQVGKDLLRGYIFSENGMREEDWLAFMSALLVLFVGFVKGSVNGDTREKIIIDQQGNAIEPPRGSTDGYLWPYHINRTRLYVQQKLSHLPIIDWELVNLLVDYGRFPPDTSVTLEPGSIHDLFRASFLIGAVADPNFRIKIRRLMLEIEESRALVFLHFPHLKAFKQGYPKYYWKVIAPLIKDASRYLNYCAEGMSWLANMNSHLLVEEHEL